MIYRNGDTGSFVTIRIFARTEHDLTKSMECIGFVTIRIFARTELVGALRNGEQSFVTIRIFARTEQTF